MQNYIAKFGDMPDSKSENYIVEADNADHAVENIANDIDRSRTPRIKFLSSSPMYGLSAKTHDGNGNGGHCRDNYLYLVNGDSGEFAGVWEVSLQ